jgi:hypothetical protein
MEWSFSRGEVLQPAPVLTMICPKCRNEAIEIEMVVSGWLSSEISISAGYNGFCGSCSTPFIEPQTSKFSSQLSA